MKTNYIPGINTVCLLLLALVLSTAGVVVKAQTLSGSGGCAGSVLTVTSGTTPYKLVWLLNSIGQTTVMATIDASATTVAGITGSGGSELNKLSTPNGVYVDGSGDVYIADMGNNRVQKWSVGATSGVTVAGTGVSGSGATQLNAPTGVYVDGSGNIFVSDYGNNRIQKWAAGSTTGITVAGTGVSGSGATQLKDPYGVYLDPSGTIYVADRGNHRIQRWSAGMTMGITVAGTGISGSGARQLNLPNGLYVDALHTVYVADGSNHRIQKWASSATTGTTVAGTGTPGSGATQLNTPGGVYVDGNGNIYVADGGNNRIQKWASGATTGTMIAGTGSAGAGPAELSLPAGICLDASGDIFVADQSNLRIQEFAASIITTYTATVAGNYIARVTPTSGTTTNTNLVRIDAPTITFCGLNSALYQGASRELYASGATTYSWSPATSLSATTGYYVTVTPTVTTTYTVTGTNSCNTGTAVVTVSVDALPSLSGSTACMGSVLTVASDVPPTQIIWKQGGTVVFTLTPTIASSAATVAGSSTGTAGSSASQFHDVTGIWIDGNSNVYVADLTNQRIQKWAPGATSGITVAGDGTAGNAASQLNGPADIFVDASGNVFVADQLNARVQKWAPGATAGITVAGTGIAGSAANQLNHPSGLFLDWDGDLYISDGSNARVQKWQPGATTGTTVVGTGVAGSGAAQLNGPAGIYMDGNLRLYVADELNQRVQRFSGVYIGGSPAVTVAGITGIAGNAANQLNGPQKVYADKNGNIYVTDGNNHRVQRWASGATAGTTLAGTGIPGTGVDQLNTPNGMYFDGSLNMYIGDGANNRVQKFTASIANTLNATPGGNYFAVVTTSAGNATTNWTFAEQTLVSAGFNVSIYQGGSSTLSASGATTYSWSPATGLSATTGANVAASPAITTTYTLTGTAACGTATAEVTVSVNSMPTLAGSTACAGSVLTLTNDVPPAKILWQLNGTSIATVTATIAPAATTVAGTTTSGSGANQLNYPLDITMDGSGNLYVADGYNYRIQKWAPGATTGITVAGTGISGSGADQLGEVWGVCRDASGNLYISDDPNHRIQKWGPGATAGTTVAGNGTPGSDASEIFFPTNVYVDRSGNIYVTDFINPRVQKWAPCATAGITVAGNGTSGNGANQLNVPRGMTVDNNGNLYIADANNARIQKWAPGATSGITVAGTGTHGNGAMQLYNPTGIYIDENDNLYIADQNNNRIQKWVNGATSGITVAGTGVSGNGATQLDNPSAVCVDRYGNIYVADRDNNRIQKFASSIITTMTATSAGSYNAIVTSVAGNATTNSMLINPLPATGATGGGIAICQGATATLSGTGASSYSWTGGISDGGAFTPTVGINTYTVTGTNSCGSSTAIATVTVNALPAISAGPETSVCIGSGTPLSAIGGSTYNWLPTGSLSTSTGSSVIASPATLTTYTVTGTDGNSCTSSATVTVTVNTYSAIATSGLMAWYPFNGNANDESGNGQNGMNNGATLTTDRFGNANSAYYFDGSSNYISTPVAFPTGGGAKSFSVWFKPSVLKRGWIVAGGQDNNGQAFGFFSQDFLENTLFHGNGPSNDIATGTFADTGIWHQAVIVYASNVLKPYIDGVLLGTFADNLNTAFSNIVFGKRQNESLESGTSAYFAGKIDDITIYNRALTDAEALELYRLGSPVNIVTGPSSVCNGSAISLDDPIPGGTWSSSDAGIASVGSNGTVTGLSAGTATISYAVTGICGTSTDTKTITINALPAPGTIIGAGHVCEGGSISLSNAAAGGVWSSVSTGVATVGVTGIVNGLINGMTTISYTVTNGCGTLASTSIVTVNALPTVGTSGGGVVICSGATATLSGTGASSYSWSGAITDGVAFTPSVGINTYTVTGNTNGCSNTAVTALTVNTLPTVGSTGGGIALCAGGTATLSGTGASAYGWTGGITNGAAFTPSAGINSYTVTGTTGGCSNTAVTTLTVNALPTVGSTGGGMALCAGGTATLSGTGAGLYSWSGGVVNGAAFTPAVGINTYTVTGTTSGCSNTAVTTLTVNPLPTVGSTGGGIALCAGGTATLSGTGASSYTWSGGVINGIAFAPTTGVHSYTVTGTNSGCSNSATTTITVNATSAGVITGASSVGVGADITLTDAAPGGTWTASNGNATVTAGLVHGVSPGTVVISYTITGICGAASATKLVTVGTSTVTVAAITGYYFYLCTGATAPFFDGTPGGTWSINAADAAIASVSATGVVTGLSAGTARLSYTVGTGSATTVVTVYPIPAAITGTGTLCKSATTALSDITPGGVWSSGIPSTATVGTGGVVTGTNPGTTPIYYTLVAPAGCRATIIVTVSLPPSAGTISGLAAVCAGSVTTFSDAISGGTWSSANISVATVSGTGVVTGVAPGLSTISYTVTTGCGSASTTRMVTVNGVTAGTINGASVVIAGTSISLSNVTAGGVWSGTNAAATVGSTGVVTGVSPGTVTVSYTLTGSCGSATATKIVTVNPSGVSGITGTLSVCAGLTTALTNATPGGVWHSANITIATAGTSGIVTGNTAGTVTISYTVGGVPTTVVVTVNASPSSIGGASSVCNGSLVTLSNFTSGGTWTSTAGVSVTTGTTVTTVTGLTDGTNTVTYSLANGCYKTYNVTVKPIPTPILGNLAVCGVGSVTFLSDATPGTSWTISPAGTATISPSGRVYGVSTGTATVTYTATNTFKTTAVVTVNALLVVAPISGANNVGHNLTISLSDATPGGTWSSSNPALGSVDGAGNVTGVGTAGTVIITYAVAYPSSGGCMAAATKTITVHTPAPHGNATSVDGTLNIYLGTSVSIGDESSSGIWSSSNTDVVTVDEGFITAISPGAANIKHIVTNSSGETVVYITPIVVNAMPVDVRIVPNPNMGTFNVKGSIGQEQDREVTIQVTDMLGQVIYSNNVTVAGGKINEAISLEKTLTNGMYLLSIVIGHDHEVFHFVIGK